MHDIAQAAADAAQVPSFDEVLRKGQRRRNVRNGLTAGGAALAVASIIGIGQLVGTDADKEPEPAPSPPSTVIEDPPAGEGPERIVDHPNAVVGDAAVSESGATAVFWRVVNREQWGLAVSGDGFVTRSLAQLPIPGYVVAAGDRFVLSDQTQSRVWVAGLDGEWTRVEVSGSDAPVADGEVPVSTSDGLVAVDPDRARAHPVDAPEQAFRIDAYGGRLTAITSVHHDSGTQTATYHWSDDGGASWHTTSFDADYMWIPQVVPSAAGTEHAIAMVSDGATIGPLAGVLTMPADGGSFAETEYDGELASFSGVWTVDGEIRFLGDLWGDGSGPPRESGVYRWADGQLERIPSSAPEVTDVDDSTLMDVVDTAGGPTLLIAVDKRLFESTDGGGTWEELAAR
ncbi:hypothetical protein D0Z08_02545 [Nocardioides immobilis]|uniref:Exo-alpha-sialidase n=1 Tax=Nocardioides immobilis TaxID=2049295 RepID=A0A417Y7M0_9ACTN|nr:hypothetical protein [Nocardioides immobilis]RHW28748.1 hypothetical protein D0Z08_02545 [Nocardioides immobilis]